MNKIKIVWKSNNSEKKYGYLRISERLTDLATGNIKYINM